LTNLHHFAAFLSNWVLENESIPAIIGGIAREEGPEDWTIGWKLGDSGTPILLVGGAFKDLTDQGQRAHTYLVVNQLLLGQLEATNRVGVDPQEAFASFWQAFYYLPKHLQAYWLAFYQEVEPFVWTSRLEGLAFAKKEKLVTRFPSIANLALDLQTYWRSMDKPSADSIHLRKQLIKTLAQQSGDLPGNLRIYLEDQIQTKHILPWQQLLRNQVKRCAQSRLQTTLKRPSKRYGTTPGIRVQGRARIGVAIDTSGSVPASSLAAFQQEIKQIAALGHPVEVLEADAQIQRNYRFQGSLPNTFSLGGGGTNYDPAIQYFAEKQPVDLLIYFTDGLGPKPEYRTNNPLIWIIDSQQSGAAFLAQHQNWPGIKLYVRN
jgi:hypothetical protein